MNFQKAKLIKELNINLIGKIYNEATIDELVLFPTNAELSERFTKLYLRTLDGDKAIIPFIGTDVDIVAIFDKNSIMKQHVLFHTSIFDLPKEFKIITE